jgi:hypothetical protein
MVLSSLGPQLGVCCDYFFQNPQLLMFDIKEIIAFFSPKDRDGNYIGLSEEDCQENCEVLVQFWQFLREEDQVLIGQFKSSDVQRTREVLARILYRRTSSHADKFFEDYKTLFGGK